MCPASSILLCGRTVGAADFIGQLSGATRKEEDHLTHEELFAKRQESTQREAADIKKRLPQMD